ncbi:MAG: VTT domain-containing protein [Prochloraceae cyanobacterium]|nr:VTT domain-containing protein [Prochloraceae cyanobacterium]
MTVNKKQFIRIFSFIAFAVLICLLIWWINKVGIEQVRSNIENFGILIPIVIFSLRMVSIVIPALPGTVYSVSAGGLLGLPVGVTVICLADLVACQISFFLARKYGRSLVKKIIGPKYIDRVDRLAQKYLEDNLFLLSGFLMTGFFDFVCYGAGLTKIKWQRFAIALVFSIAISNPPLVALGAGLLTDGKILLILAILGTFSLAILTGFLKRKQYLNF